MKSVRPLNQAFNISIYLPGSKSITLRDTVLAALANGKSKLQYPGDGNDIRRMEQALQRLGISIENDQQGAMLVEGQNGHFCSGTVELDVGLSATSTRFLIALSALRRDMTCLDGHPSMRARPNKYLVDAISALGASVTSTNDGYLPISIQGPASYAQTISMKGDVSSQYFSALMQIAPLLPDGLEIKVEGDLVSKPYIDITISGLLATFRVGSPIADRSCTLSRSADLQRCNGQASPRRRE